MQNIRFIFMLSIHLLGAPQIIQNQQPLRISRRKSRALLYYLAAETEPQPRNHLVSIFWPELDRNSAQQSLRTTLYGLRKTLGDHLLINDFELALNPATEVDSRIFQTHTQSPLSNFPTPQFAIESLTKTLSLYRGEFLEGFSLPNSAAFDDWQVLQAEEFRRLAIRGYTALSRLHEASQDYRASLDTLDRALAFDPLQEDLQRAALRLHYFAGDRAGAVRRYDKLRNLLDEEMGVPPMAETRALYDAIITDTLPNPEPVQTLKRFATLSHPPPRPLTIPASLPFTGRAAELQHLRELAPKHQLLLLEGEPGIGKTRLAQEFLRTSGAFVLSGAARELEQSLPYQPVIEALRSLLHHPSWETIVSQMKLSPFWLEETARLLPELASLIPGGAFTMRGQGPRPGIPGLPGPSAESRLWEGVTRFISSLAAVRPVVFFLDDLQWADESTLALLSYFIRNTGEFSTTFITATRPVATRTPLWTLLQSLTRENRLAKVSLSRLTDAEIKTLTTHLAPHQSDVLMDWLSRNSEGIPFILTELTRYLQENGILSGEILNIQMLSESPIVPQTVYSLIQSRLAQLSEEARRILDVAVVVGREFDFEIVQRASGLSETAALDALDELRTAGLILPLDRWRFSIDHILTMEVSWHEVGEARHRMLHRRVAETLEKMNRNHLDEVAGLLAFHYSEGLSPDRAAPFAFQAGKQAARLAAWREAIAFYDIALSGTDAAHQYDQHMALGEARELGGDPQKASEAYRDALHLAISKQDRPAANTSRLALGRSLIPQGRYQEMIALARDVLADGDPFHLMQAEFLWGTALSIEGADLQEARDHLKKAETMAYQLEDTSTLAAVAFESGSISAQQGDLVNAIALYRQTLSVVQDSEDETAEERLVLAYNNLAYHLLLLGQIEEARTHAQTGLTIAERRGLLGLLPYLHSTRGEIALKEGDIHLAEEQFKQGLDLAQRLENPERIAGLTANLGLTALQQGKTPVAIHRLSSALARADTLGIHHLAAQIRIWLAPHLPPDEAHQILAEARAIAEEGGRKGLLEQIAKLKLGT